MHDNEYTLKEAICDLKSEVKSLTELVNGIKVFIASDCIKKDECNECKNTNERNHNLIIGWLIGNYTVIILAATAIIMWSQ